MRWGILQKPSTIKLDMDRKKNGIDMADCSVKKQKNGMKKMGGAAVENRQPTHVWTPFTI
jgi:hypothetical protein